MFPSHLKQQLTVDNQLNRERLVPKRVEQHRHLSIVVALHRALAPLGVLDETHRSTYVRVRIPVERGS